MSLTRPLVSLSLALALGLAGCGGDADDVAPVIAKADYLEQGNTICSEGNNALDAIGDNLDQNDTEAVLAAIKDQVVPLVQDQIDDLRALGYPAGDKTLLEGYFSDTEEILDSWSEDPGVALEDTRMDPINEALISYGLTECGS